MEAYPTALRASPATVPWVAEQLTYGMSTSLPTATPRLKPKPTPTPPPTRKTPTTPIATTTAELEKMEREAHHNLDFSQISPNKDEIREVKYTRKPSTWDLMKQTADPKELRELQQIEEKHMKKKNNSAYQIAMAAHDEIIKKTI